MMAPSIKSSILLTFSVAASLVSSSACPPIAHFPPPQLLDKSVKDHPQLGSYLKSLTQLFDAFSSNSTLAGYNTTHTSFSIQITNPNHREDDPIWEYSYTAANVDPRGTKKVTPKTQFRVGSVSKLLTMIGVLKAGIGLEDSIVKYIPELKNIKRAGKSWDDVTIKALGSHLAGVQRDFGFAELALLDPTAKVPGTSPVLQGAGLPPLDTGKYPPCEFPPYFPQACTKDQFLSIVATQPPVVLPFSQPVYSNSAFQLLAYAVENATGVAFPEYMRKNVFEPLKMEATFFPTAKDKVDDSNGSIPPKSTLWGIDFGSNTPGGGLYSSSSDISKLMLSLLPSTANKAPLLTPHPAATNKFLAPASFLQGTNVQSFGTPWEIFRPEANNGALTIYTKSGGIDGYTAEAVMIPEYDVAISIVASGESVAIALLDYILQYIDNGKEQGLLVGGFGGVARAETKAQYDGVFTAEAGLNSSITVSASEDVLGGLNIKSWTSNGSDMLSLLPLLRPRLKGIDARLYPVNLFGSAEDTKYEGGLLRKEEWKVILLEKPSTSAKPKIKSYLDGSCDQVYSIDFARHAGEPVDRVLVWRKFEGNSTTSEAAGKIIGLEIPALRVVLKKD